MASECPRCGGRSTSHTILGDRTRVAPCGCVVATERVIGDA